MSRERGTPVSVFADWRRNSDRTRKLQYSIDLVWGLWVKSFYRVTKKTVRVRKGTMAGGGGSAGFEQEKGFKCFSFCSLEACFKQEQGITILYRLDRFFFGQIVLPGDQEDRQGPKRCLGGGWGRYRV